MRLKTKDLAVLFLETIVYNNCNYVYYAKNFYVGTGENEKSLPSSKAVCVFNFISRFIKADIYRSNDRGKSYRFEIVNDEEKNRIMENTETIINQIKNYKEKRISSKQIIELSEIEKGINIIRQGKRYGLRKGENIICDCKYSLFDLLNQSNKLRILYSLVN
jgi:hypothetical protein